MICTIFNWEENFSSSKVSGSGLALLLTSKRCIARDGSCDNDICFNGQKLFCCQ